jgi:hypothetical protein
MCSHLKTGGYHDDRKKSMFVLTVKCLIIILTVCLTLMIGSQSFAEICPNLIGDWDYTSNYVRYNPNTDSYTLFTETGVIHITDQNNCVFYGTNELLSPNAGIYPVLGTIYNNKSVIIVTANTALDDYHLNQNTVQGFLFAYNSTRKLYKKIKFSAHNAMGGAGELGASQGTLIRRK